MSDRGELYKGHRILGMVVGTAAPFRSVGRIETEFASPGWGWWLQETDAQGEHQTADEAREAGLQRARDFVDLNPHLLRKPREGRDES